MNIVNLTRSIVDKKMLSGKCPSTRVLPYKKVVGLKNNISLNVKFSVNIYSNYQLNFLFGVARSKNNNIKTPILTMILI